MKPERIILVRHGESEGNKSKDIYASKPDYALDLTPEGYQQALEAGKKLREIVGSESVHFWISPYLRTRHTFKGIAKSFNRCQVHRVYEDLRLREQEWGHFREPEAITVLEAERDTYGAILYRFPFGESVADTMDRQVNVIDSIWRDFNDPKYCVNNLVIVTHGRTVRAFCSVWFHWNLEYCDQLANPKNCEIWVMSQSSDNRYKVPQVWTRKEKGPYEMLSEPRVHNVVPCHHDYMSEFIQD